MTDEVHGAGTPPEGPTEPVEAPQYDLPTPMSPDEADRLANARKVLTAFLVVVEPDGTSWATNDVNMDMVLERPPTMGDMYRGCAEVMKDITTSEASQRTVVLMMQATQQVAAQQQQDKIAAQLAQKGLRVPGR